MEAMFWRRRPKLPNAFLALVAIGCLFLPALTGSAQDVGASVPAGALGYCQITTVSSAKKLSDCSGGIPAGANLALIQPEAQAVRWRDDPAGTAPSATVGFPLAVGVTLRYAGNLTLFQAIEQTSGAKLNVVFYKSP